MQVRVGGVLVVTERSSLVIEEAIGERSICNFIAIDQLGTANYRDAQPVEVRDGGGVLLFAGFIDRVQVKRVSPFQPHMLHHITCKDNHYLADKRIVARAYQNLTAGAIVRDILTTVLVSEGVIEGVPTTIQAGPLVREAVFNYASVNVALDVLAEQAGFVWWIDASRTLHFVTRATYSAPWAVTQADTLANSVEVTIANPKYRNRQYIKGVRDATDPQIETRRGDGTNRAFTMGFPLARVPVVEVSRAAGAWTAQTVGIKGIEQGRQWGWAKGDAVLSQNLTQTVLAAADQIRVTYQGEFDIVVLSQDQAAIHLRQATEGVGSGVVEDVSGTPDISSRSIALQTAVAKLRQFAQLGRRIKFTTRRTGLSSGQLLRVTLPEHSMDNLELLVEQVRISISNVGQVLYDIIAVEGPGQGSWTQLFATMARHGSSFIELVSIGGTSVLALLEENLALWTWSTSITQRIFSCPLPSEALFPSMSLHPC